MGALTAGDGKLAVFHIIIMVHHGHRALRRACGRRSGYLCMNHGESERVANNVRGVGYARGQGRGTSRGKGRRARAMAVQPRLLAAVFASVVDATTYQSHECYLASCVYASNDNRLYRLDAWRLTSGSLNSRSAFECTRRRACWRLLTTILKACWAYGRT